MNRESNGSIERRSLATNRQRKRKQGKWWRWRRRGTPRSSGCYVTVLRRRHTENRSVSRVSAAVNVNTTAHKLIVSARKHRASSRYVRHSTVLPVTSLSFHEPNNPLIIPRSIPVPANIANFQLSSSCQICVDPRCRQNVWTSVCVSVSGCRPSFRLHQVSCVSIAAVYYPCTPSACKVGWKDAVGGYIATQVTFCNGECGCSCDFCLSIDETSANETDRSVFAVRLWLDWSWDVLSWACYDLL